MSKVFRCLVLDLKKGTISQWKRYLVCFIAILGLLYINDVYISWSAPFYGADSFSTLSPSLGELIISLYGGMDFYYPDSGMPFSMPVEWMFVVLLVLFLSLDYPLSDLSSTGQNALVMSSSRTAWWLAKCFWVLFMVIIFCFIVLLAALLITLCMGGSLSLDISSTFPSILAFNTSNLTTPAWNIGSFLVAVPIWLCALCLVQLFLSLAIRPLPAFGCIAVFLFLSAYYANPLLPGEYLMAARSAIFLMDGYQTITGLVFALVLAGWAIVSGIFTFKQCDFYGKE